MMPEVIWEELSAETPVPDAISSREPKAQSEGIAFEEIAT
jgi:hypothetical protein